MLAYPYGWLVTIAVTLLLIGLVLSAPLRIHGEIKRTGNNDEIELDLRSLFGFLHYRWHIPLLELTESGIDVAHNMQKTDALNASHNASSSRLEPHHITSFFGHIKQVLQQTENLNELVLQTLRKVRLTKWKWNTIIGVDDAMWTAMTISAIWSIKTTLIGIASQLVNLHTAPELSVQPNYRRAQFSTEWSCVAQIPIGYAIFAYFRLRFFVKKSIRDTE